MKSLFQLKRASVLVVCLLFAVSCSKPAVPAPSSNVAEAAAASPQPDQSLSPQVAQVPMDSVVKAEPAAQSRPALPQTRKPAPKPTQIAKTPPAPAPVPAKAEIDTEPVIFEAANSQPSFTPAPDPPPAPKPVERRITLPSGTLIPVRMIDSVDSKTDRVGRTFRASLDEDIVSNGETVLPKGADVEVKLTRAQASGDIKGRSELELQLDRISVGNRTYVVESNVFQTSGQSQGTNTLKKTGVGAAIGAAIGAIAGGKKGAAIGATVGGGTGATAAILTKDEVRIESETPLVFRLEQPLEVTAEPGSFNQR